MRRAASLSLINNWPQNNIDHCSNLAKNMRYLWILLECCHFLSGQDFKVQQTDLTAQVEIETLKTTFLWVEVGHLNHVTHPHIDFQSARVT